MHLNGRDSSRIPTPPAEFIDVQRGGPLITVLSISSALTIIATAIWPHVLGTMALLMQLAAAVCFCTLFIRVKKGLLRWQFGPGWIRGKMPLSEITGTTLVRTPFAYGWGLERTKWGWRFNRKGALAIVIRRREGQCLRLGTARAAELQQFLAAPRHARV